MTQLGPPQSWRELLGQLTQQPAERQRVAEALGVTPYTITRWVSGESEPRVHNLKRLPEVFPAYQQLFSQLVQAELTPPIPGATASHSSQAQIPAEFLARLLSAVAVMTGPLRAWSIRTLALQQALKHLSRDGVGMQISVVQCTPALPGRPVRSLCTRLSIATAPWEAGVRSRLVFQGAESLCGTAVGRGQPAIVPDLEASDHLSALLSPGPQKSAAVWPFLREGKLAGCLLSVSTHPDSWMGARLSALESYANAIALSFRDEEFTALHQISLHEVPVHAAHKEHQWLSRLREQVILLRRERQYQLAEAEAERTALQQLEEELLQSDVR